MTTQEQYNHSNRTSASRTQQEQGVDGCIPDTLVCTFDYSRSHGIRGRNPRYIPESDVLSTATPPASARGAVAVDIKRPPLAERNYPMTHTSLQSPDRSTLDQGGSQFLVW